MEETHGQNTVTHEHVTYVPRTNKYVEGTDSIPPHVF